MKTRCVQKTDFQKTESPRKLKYNSVFVLHNIIHYIDLARA